MSVALTNFQLFVLRMASRGPNQTLGARTIAENLPGWRTRASHGALVAHVERAAYQLENMGLAWRLPPKDQFENGRVSLREAGLEWLERYEMNS